MRTRSRDTLAGWQPWAAALLLALPAARGASLDAAPFALPLPDGPGLQWEDPREIHRVVAQFKGAAPAPESARLEYWGSRWPGQRLPKDREPGGGDTGWMELGNWHQYEWRVADAEVRAEGSRLVFTFRPVNAREFPKIKDYPAPFRHTLKLRVTGAGPLPPLEKFEAFTDSVVTSRVARVVWQKPPAVAPSFDAFNGRIESVEAEPAGAALVRLQAAHNPDPNTFDRTLVTVSNGATVFTFAVDDLNSGPLFSPALGAAVLPGGDPRDYAAVAAESAARGARTLRQRVNDAPEQTWRAAWDGMPPKKSRIYFPLGLDGGRQRFRLNADGSLEFRSNDGFLRARPGADTAALGLEKSGVNLQLGLPGQPADRTLQEESLPVCVTTWAHNGLIIRETALVTRLEGLQAAGPVPPADASTVFLAEFVFSNTTSKSVSMRLPVRCQAGGKTQNLTLAETGAGAGRAVQWRTAAGVRGLIEGEGMTCAQETGGGLSWQVEVPAGGSRRVILKVPYLILAGAPETAALAALKFDAEREAAAGYWRRRLDESARLITPEPMLNEFYRSHAMHLLVNCEREPGAERRFARVGSFSYAAYGNESCMMVVDLDRRGYHAEARECLDAWLHYQGTVGLPGSFAGKDGVLYGAGGYEAGGYNQHHGWILWMLAEHYRFTRDGDWLRKAAPGIARGAEWILRETARTASRHPLERGLLPAGSLEDIGDWWTWLSTSCYTWRGLDAAGWALQQAGHPDAARVRDGAARYHAALLANFREASRRSPIVRLRDGTAVPQIPSQVHRRGRSFGWICQTLEGAIHLLITRALPPDAPEAAWILNDYEDNLYLSNQYGYQLPDFERHWFSRGGMSMQACLLLDVEPYLDRDEVKSALRALFNGQSVSYFPDVRMNTEHALPEMGDWRGDHFKSSDEANTAGWLRQLFVREEDRALVIGQAVPREWLQAGRRCGIERAATYFGPASIVYEGAPDTITARLDAPRRNPPESVRLRFREPGGRPLASVTVNGKPWTGFGGEWVQLPGDCGAATVVARFAK